ncbi:MAG: carbohydrate binding family 9 domain-containing protein, partial [Chitinophagales bacterium]|nr:carbohydrate binding family 9 domain-containing protein [Chitinophagales bacterium]
MFKLLCFYGLLLLATATNAQQKIPIHATRTLQPPKIDGKLNDGCWKDGNPFSDLIQSVPEYGLIAKDRTEVIILYDDDAVYLSAKCFMNPDSIWMQFTERDDIFDNTDVLSIAFDTYHDGQNGFAFGVSPRNVQSDFKFYQNSNSDDTWDAVWESQVYIADDGWYVEMKIPYSALRFPKMPVQNWYIDVYRTVRRNRHEYHSAGIDPKENGIVSQFQPLIGVSDIQPPLRLSVSPYITVYDNLFTSKLDNISDNNIDFKGGIDLKWGINESFTLDATLIPDFGQVQSDNLIYNLSAFEVQYDENRSFFTEGTELFNKADLFYSRRIGFISDYYESHADTNVTLTNYPTATPLLNATKISGRTKNGLGIGFFNA